MNPQTETSPIEFKNWHETPVTFIDDVYYFAIWANANGWLSELARTRPCLERQDMGRLVELAVALFEQTGVSPSSLTSLEDLVSVRNFALLIDVGPKAISALEFERLISLLLAMAREWVKLPAWHMTALYNMADVRRPKPARPIRRRLLSFAPADLSGIKSGGKFL